MGLKGTFCPNNSHFATSAFMRKKKKRKPCQPGDKKFPQGNRQRIFLAPTGKWEALWTAFSQRAVVEAVAVEAVAVEAADEEEENSHFLQ